MSECEASPGFPTPAVNPISGKQTDWQRGFKIRGHTEGLYRNFQGRKVFSRYRIARDGGPRGPKTKKDLKMITGKGERNSHC